MTVAEGAPTLSSAEIMSGGAVVAALPRTRACADVARSFVREVLKGLLPERLGDALVMTSELAANAFIHGLGAREADDRQEPSATRSEVAIYRRGAGADAELVCTVFDPRPNVDAIPESAPCILSGIPDKRSDETLPPDILDDLLQQLETGKRGLDVVRTLSNGRTGFYRTRSRLGVRPVSGKAAWFALPIPAQSPAAWPPANSLSPAQAVKELRSQLDCRGIGRMYHSDLPGQSVLSAPHVTIWCRGRHFMWRADDVAVRYAFTDLIEAAEQVVRISEDREYARLGPISW
jgi:hypothetical protein